MNQLIKALLQHRLAVILFSLALVLAAALGARQLEFRSDYRVFFSPENPQLRTFERLQNEFSKTDNLLFILVPDSGQVFNRETLTAIQWLTEAAWQTPFSTRVDSLTNFQHSFAEDDTLVVEDLVRSPGELSSQELADIRRIALEEPQLKRRLVSLEADVAAVNVTLQLPGKNPMAEIPEVVDKARSLKSELEARHPGIDVKLTGVAMMTNAFTQSAVEDSQTLIPLMILVIFLLVGVLNRTWSGTLAALLVLGASIGGALGMAGWLGIHLSSPSASAPTVIMTVAVADCVHVLSTFFHHLRAGADRTSAIAESLRVNWKPILLTSLTTAIGFLSLNFSDSPPFRDLGNIVAMGVIFALLFSLSLLPALLMLLPVRIRPGEESNQRWMNRLADFVIGRQRLLLVSCSLVTLFALLMLPRNELNDNFVEYFDRDTQFRQATEFSNEHLTGLAYMEVELDAGTPQGIYEPEFMRQAAAFSAWARQQPESIQVTTLTDRIKRLNMNLHGDDPEHYRLPDQRQEIAQYLLLYEMSLPYGLDLNNQINLDKSAIRVVVNFENLSSLQLLDMEKRMEDWLAANAPALEPAISGPPLMFAHIGQRNIKSLLGGTALALVLISALLVLALRSLRHGLLSLVPNLAPMVIAFGAWGLLVGEIGLGLSVVAGMTLGIVVDDSVHFLSKYLHARRKLDLVAEDAVRYAFNTVGRALWITTLALASGFLILAQSDFRVNGDMGLLTAATIGIALILDFLLLPALLLWLDGPSRSSAKASGEGKAKADAENAVARDKSSATKEPLAP